jgi:hypothetical protein
VGFVRSKIFGEIDVLCNPLSVQRKMYHGHFWLDRHYKVRWSFTM